MTVIFKGRKTLPSIDLNKMTIDGEFLLDPSNTYTNSPVSGKKCHFTVRSFDNANQEIEQVLTDRTTGYVYKRIIYNSFPHAFPSSNTSLAVPWYRIYGLGQKIDADLGFSKSATYNIASAALPTNNIYTQNAVTVVSDERHKNDISELTQQELECAIACGKLYRRYKLNKATDEKGDEARFHIGVISQDIVKCFDDHGLDWKQYGVVTYEKWDAIQAVEYQSATYDEQGNQLTPEVQAVDGHDGGEIYMVRYEELNCFINAGLEYRLTQLEK